MIIINNKKFAVNKSEFASNKECIGFYQVYKNVIYFYDATMNKIAFLNKNKAFGKAEKQGKKTWHSFVEVEVIGKPSYSEVQDIAYKYFTY